MTREQYIVDCYVNKKFSEKQIASHLFLRPSEVRRVLNQKKVKRRSRSDAIRHLYITKHGKQPFRETKVLNRQQKILKVTGVMLYWGEGTKKGSSVALANSDPKMVLVFLKFLREICGVDEKRLRVGLHYYQDHDADKLVTFWSTLTNIPPHQFDRPFLHASGKGSYNTKSLYGTVLVRYSDIKLLSLLVSWIEEHQRKMLE